MTQSTIASYDYTEINLTVHHIIDVVASYMKASREDIQERIWWAYIFAREAHEGQMRKSGEPYITHPLEAVKLLLLLKPDIVSIQACILHDVIEDTPKTKNDIEKLFGEDVANICEWLSKLSAIRYFGEERTVWSLRKMLLAMVDDLRVIMVKLADRLHNMQTLDHHPDAKKRQRIALETLNIYAPIADRLGIFQFKEMLETECFRILDPERYAEILKELEELRDEQNFFVQKAEEVIRGSIPTNVPIMEISYRIKAPYSILKKLERKEFSYTHTRDLYDLFAIRIITDSVPHCYEVLWVLHNVFTPMPKRFKDYIALPKENGYQSLHTTVVGMFPELRSQPTEIQIRTASMHRQAEVWVAAHFEYSEKWKSIESRDSYWVKTIKWILESVEEGSEFMDEMKVNVFSDQIFVFTPKGDIITLPKWATPVDFAYSIHSNLGNHLAIAKANGHVVPLDYTLKNGESVQVITDPHRKPSPAWISSAKTSRARDYIRQFINRDSRDILIEKWRSILNSYLEKNYGNGIDKEMSILRFIDGHSLDMKQREDVLVQVGNLSRKPSSIMKAIHDDVIKDLFGQKKEEIKVSKETKPKKEIEPAPDLRTVIIWKERDVPYKFAQCCNPVEWDRIVGYIGQWLVTVHKFDCENIDKIHLDRRIPAYWSGGERRGVTIEIECIFRDKLGLLRQITDIFFHMELNIESLKTETLPKGEVRDTFVLHTDEEDYYIYDRLVERLQFDIDEFIEGKLISMS
jgi:GTP diphosphokinase / guanosine-3',5'-bis(diphosphate) 3'-diphosphatase